MAARNPIIRIDVINRLLEANKDAPFTADSHGWLPLHHAVASDRLNISLVERMLELFKAGCMKPCKEGLTPLHLLVRRHVARVEDCFMERNGRDMSDLSALKEMALECAQVLIRANSKCVRVCDLADRSPLHSAADSFCPDQGFIELLSDMYGAALKLADKAGELPLHLLLRRLRLPEVAPPELTSQLTAAFGVSLKVALDFVRLDKETIKVRGPL